MTKTAPIRRARKPSEEGMILLFVIFLVALLTIALAVALPKVSREIQRDREIETMHRGKQYIRGLRMYYKKFGAYPQSADALTKPTNMMRFMRKKYADPTTGKADWKPVLIGQNKAPTAMGFFGQPLGMIGGCAAGGTGANPLAANLTSSTSTFGPSTGGSSTGSVNSNCPGAGLTPSTGMGASTDPNANTTATTDPNSSGSAFGQSGQTFGGAGIMGFSPNSLKPSIMVYKTKTHYNEWEFVYDPIADGPTLQLGNNGPGPGLTGPAPGVPIPPQQPPPNSNPPMTNP